MERNNFSSHDYLFDYSGKLKYEAESIRPVGLFAKGNGIMIKKGASYGVLDHSLNILVPIKYNSVETTYSDCDPCCHPDNFCIYKFNNNVPWQKDNFEDVFELKAMFEAFGQAILISCKRPYLGDSSVCFKTMKQYLITCDNLRIDLSGYRVGDFYEGIARVYLNGFRFYITLTGEK